MNSEIIKNVKDLIKNLRLKITLNSGESFEVSEFVEKDNQNYLFNLNDYIVGSLNFNMVEKCIMVSAEIKVINETSYRHCKFVDSGISVLFNVEKDSNLLAHHNYNSWWTMPIFCENESEIPKDTQVLSWQNKGETYVVQTLCDSQFKSIIHSNEKSCAVTLNSNTSGFSYIKTKVFVISYDCNPYKAFENAMSFTLGELDAAVKKSSERVYPEMFNYLGFCTWNAFYSDVAEVGVIEKANEFVDKNLPVKWFLIDHGWSQAEHEKLSSFKEDFVKFPSGLKGLKNALKEKNVDYLGVWQGFSGHWGTIAENSEVHMQMKDCLVKTYTGDLIPRPTAESAFSFWNAWHSYVKSQGIDFVKVDIQSSLSVFTEGLMSIGEASRGAHLGLDASASVNFNGAIINCMGMAMEQVLNRPAGGISRNSNDFFPHKVNSFKKHVFENAYNTLYHGHVYHGDWDMWWTNHEDSVNNAYLRALSGGPLYISDRLGETDDSKIRPLILNDGFVLRCDNQGVVVGEQIFKNASLENEAVKVCNIKGETGYIGAFNCRFDDESVTARIKPSDIHFMATSQNYLSYDYKTNSSKIVKYNEVQKVNLLENQSIFMSFTPIIDGFAFLGSVDKYVSSAVIKERIGNIFVLNYAADIMFYSEKEVNVKINGETVKFECDNNIYKVAGVENNAVLEVIIK